MTGAPGVRFGGECRIRETEIVTDGRGRPKVRLDGGACRFGARQGIGEILVSLSHSGSAALARAVAVGAVEDEED